MKEKKHRRGAGRAAVLLLLALAAAAAWYFGRGLLFPQAEGSGAVSQSLVQAAPEQIPPYAGEDWVELNGNQPCFLPEDAAGIRGEYFSPLDRLGRCGVVYARIDRSMMPTQEREGIGMIKPSGWHTVTYPEQIPDRYLYNRCHLIAYALTGQNANELNLITGTRYFNVSAMLPFELQVMRYLESADNHVLYRVTPYFAGRELVARGVEIEALSVEDRGRGLCFHVFVYNQQPGIEIDYLTGESRIME